MCGKGITYIIRHNDNNKKKTLSWNIHPGIVNPVSKYSLKST